MSDEWLVWQLVDSAFPAGGFAHSAGLEAAAHRNGAAAPHRGVAGAVGAGVYGLVMLLALQEQGWPAPRREMRSHARIGRPLGQERVLG